MFSSVRSLCLSPVLLHSFLRPFLLTHSYSELVAVGGWVGHVCRRWLVVGDAFLRDNSSVGCVESGGPCLTRRSRRERVGEPR